MRFMALITGSDGYRAVHELLIEGCTVMTAKAEPGSILANTQQKLADITVRFVAVKARPLLYR